MDTHEDTAYECHVCRRVLNSRRTLRKHLLAHEDKCRHICSYCNKAFKIRQTLKDYMKTDGLAVSVPVAKNEVEAM
ncbi:putative zinc finger protein [Operophtera brumata]|uniref:Putative zinc finger protein n=1 Tax=Operophtera brumata TaxID=104452 RepID=A0A0L7LVB4_OPEBR|nr:putative zinc finger protein [Operophtera brumata]